MNHVVIVAGGVGSRMRLDIPKQYYEVGGKPIIMYSITRFALNPLISSIVVVLADEWRPYLSDIVMKESYSSKVIMVIRKLKWEHTWVLVIFQEHHLQTLISQ